MVAEDILHNGVVLEGIEGAGEVLGQGLDAVFLTVRASNS